MIYPLFVFLFRCFFLLFIFRSRLSLDLNSPTSITTITTTTNTTELPINNFLGTKKQNTNNLLCSSPNNTTSTSKIIMTNSTSSSCNSSSHNNNQSSNNNNINNNVILSPRYTEFKTFNSTFDGLQALEKSSNINNNNNPNSNTTGNSTTTTTSIKIDCGTENGTSPVSTITNNSNISTVLLNASNHIGGVDIPLTRVSSLPVISAQSLSGKFFFHCYTYEYLKIKTG